MTTPFLGEIKIFAGNFAIKGYAFCNGQILSIAQNTALFSILGTTYGGNGTTNFALPNLQGQGAIGVGQGPGLSNYVLGQTAGVSSVTLTLNQLPVHNHQVFVTVGTTEDLTPAAGDWYGRAAKPGRIYSSQGADTDLALPAVGGTGGSQPHNNMQPYLGLSYIIALQGIFPTRN